ncbi:protein RICE SALT SENSITIVE 3-like [Senna tora]|uniref:Protein RICE SALT SENSITIVE 3-like n=1 Tax=Senna tora TaxID=362788 RepID=A0A834TAN5_9FABA|nr:protein RICE SALT SENSITIVE 3-like [Senna tora]
MLEHDRLTRCLQVGTSTLLFNHPLRSPHSSLLTLAVPVCIMESGLPLLNCLLQHTLRTLCSSSDSSLSSKWVYAVFWRILPRNYPPPRWEFGGTALDRSKGNKRNWILVWEDGFCDFNECERARSGYLDAGFGADVFFKMSHEVYSYGEGLVGKVAVDNSHKWVYRDTPNESESSYIASWNASVEPRPRAWEYQFNSGIQTIVVIAVREGIVQLGSLNKIAEDLNLVMTIQRKFSYLQNVPGAFAIQRPYLPIQHPYILKPNNIHMMESNETAVSVYNMSQVSGVKRLIDEASNYASTKSINLGWNSPRPPLWSPPPPLPKLSSLLPSYDSITNLHDNRIISTGQRVKLEDCGFHITHDADQKPSFNTNMELQGGG